MKELEIINPNRTSLEERKEYNRKLEQEFYNSNNKKELLERKNKKIKYKKIAVYATFITIITSGTLISSKIHKDNMQKRATILNENKTFKSIVIEKGDTIESIAKEVYNELPEDKKAYITFKDFKKEIINMNGLKNPDKIIADTNLLVPYYLEEKEKTY